MIDFLVGCILTVILLMLCVAAWRYVPKSVWAGLGIMALGLVVLVAGWFGWMIWESRTIREEKRQALLSCIMEKGDIMVEKGEKWREKWGACLDSYTKDQVGGSARKFYVASRKKGHTMEEASDNTFKLLKGLHSNLIKCLKADDGDSDSCTRELLNSMKAEVDELEPRRSIYPD